jgi:ABC-type methionine transport system permease subunit
MTEHNTQPTSDTALASEAQPRSTNTTLWVVVGVIILIAVLTGIVFAIIAMVQNPTQTETVRDIVIIFVAVEALLIGLALIILIFQLARLTDLLRNEIGPILDSTNEALGNLRGTTRFLSNNLVQPVVKVNSSFAALRRVVDLLGFRRNQ